MIYGPCILNLRLCFMKGHVIRHTRPNFLISVLHSQIVWGGSAYNWTSFLKVIDVELGIEISDSNFEISHVNE